MGADLILFPRVRVDPLIFLGFFSQSVALPAWVMLLYWAFLQLVGGVGQIGSSGGGVAFWAHVGGFVAGVALAKMFVRRHRLVEHRSHQWRPTSAPW
jgi:membrane associated rhomboid family serine protease